MIKAIDVIDVLPDELAKALQCNPFFDDIPIAVAERGNVLKEIQRLQSIVQAKNGKWGVSVIVLQLVADDDEPNIAFGAMKLRPAFQVIELPEQNNSPTGTGKSARKVARQIRDIIKPLALHGLCTEFVFEPECIQPVAMAAANLVGYQVNCHTYEADNEPISQASTPLFALSEDNSQLIITSVTPGAVIYYTTDETFPIPASKDEESTAQVYSSPIPIPAKGFTVRAIALAPEMIGSQVMLAQIDPPTS